jgi:hypothetical protein
MQPEPTQIEYCESIGGSEPPTEGASCVTPYRRLAIHGGFIALATEVLPTGERPIASGLLSEDATRMLASLVRAARWEGFPAPGTADAGIGSHWATLAMDDRPTERVVLRFEPQTGADGLFVRDGVRGFTGTVLAALGTLLDAAWDRGTKGVHAWQPPPLDGPRDTIPSPDPTKD